MRPALYLICLVGVSDAATWNNQNNPQWWWYTPNTNLNSLPLSGTSSNPGWSGTYWPNKYGGIAHRWVLGAERPSFNYKLYTLPELKAMSLDQLKTLSPAEKYDIYNNRLDYPTVKSEWRRTSPSHPRWFGLCHGWAPASILYKEPNPVTLTAPNGIQVPFGSSDVKGLLTYYLAQYASLNLKMLGHRCEQTAATGICAQDMNAGSMFVILANEVGSKRRPVILDVDPAQQVWNQPIVGYTCSKQNLGTTRAQMSCSLRYVMETQPTWQRQSPNILTETYKFALEMNGGKITGGSWLPSNKRHPDFVWSVKDTPAFTGYMAKLGTIYAASQRPGSGSSAPTSTVTPTPTLSSTPTASRTPARRTSTRTSSRARTQPATTWTQPATTYTPPAATTAPTYSSTVTSPYYAYNPNTGSYTLNSPATSPSVGSGLSTSTSSGSYVTYGPAPAAPRRRRFRTSALALAPAEVPEAEPLYVPSVEARCSLTADLMCADRICEGSVAHVRRPAELAPLCAIWKISCPARFSRVKINFSEFDTTPGETEVKVYEGLDGPLYTSVSGRNMTSTHLDSPLEIPASSAQVIFESVADVDDPERIGFSYKCLR